MQPCSQPREGLIDCSKPTSGLAVVEMMLLAVSRYTSVLNGSSSPKPSQPSSNGSRCSPSKRPTRFERAPRPRRRPASMRSRACGSAGARASGLQSSSTTLGSTLAHPWLTSGFGPELHSELHPELHLGLHEGHHFELICRGSRRL